MHSAPAACPAVFIAPLTAPEYCLPTSQQIDQAAGSIPSMTPKHRASSTTAGSLPGVNAVASSNDPVTVIETAPTTLLPIHSPYRLDRRSLAHPPNALPMAPI